MTDDDKLVLCFQDVCDARFDELVDFYALKRLVLKRLSEPMKNAIQIKSRLAAATEWLLFAIHEKQSADRVKAFIGLAELQIEKAKKLLNEPVKIN